MAVNQSVINKAKKDYNEAYKRGDKAGMAKAHAAAEAERAKAGYSGGADGSQHIKLNSGSNKSSSSSVKRSTGVSNSKSSTSGRYNTTVYDKAGNAQSGYISNGQTFLANGTRLPDGYSSIDASGRKWVMQGGKGVLASQKTNTGERFRAGSDGKIFDANFDYGTYINSGLENGMSASDLEEYARANLSKFTDPEFAKYASPERITLYEAIIKQAESEREKASEEEDRLAEIMNEINGYENEYDDIASGMISNLKNRQNFSYNPDEDLLAQILSQAYAQRGDDAMNDVLAEYSSMTGGMPSSAAISAAQQAKNQYNQEYMNMIPQLEQAAYQRYLGDYQMDYDLLNSVIGLQGQTYDQFANAMNQKIGINEYLSGLGYQKERDKASDNQFNKNFDYQVSRDKVLDDQWLMQFNEEQRRAAVEEAISKKQISIDEGNLALSRAKYNSQQAGQGADDSNTLSYAYHCMVNGLDPETGENIGVTGNEWLNRNAAKFSDDELEKFMQYMKTMNGYSDRGLML